MQYKVPQNIEIEDKVISLLTLRQFMILLVGAMIVGIFRTLTPFLPAIIFILFAIMIMGAAGIVAFYRYNEKPLEIFILAYIQTVSRARQRVWRKEEWREDIIKVAPKKEELSPIYKPEVKEIKSELAALAKMVDSGGYAGQNNFILQEKAEEIDLVDALIATERPKESIVTLLTDAAEKAKSSPKEPKISQMASVSPFKSFIEPEQKVISNEEVNKILNKIRDRENKNIELFRKARIGTFHGGFGEKEPGKEPV